MPNNAPCAVVSALRPDFALPVKTVIGYIEYPGLTQDYGKNKSPSIISYSGCLRPIRNLKVLEIVQLFLLPLDFGENKANLNSAQTKTVFSSISAPACA